MFKQSQKLSAGVTLLEMMVALLVLSIGLLGVATLQSRGQQFNQVAYVRTQATFLAYDLMEKIKINQSLASNGAGIYNGECPGDMSCDEDDIYCVTKCDGDDHNCTVGDLAEYDKGQWCGLLRGTLPGGSATLVWVTAPNKTQYYQITIQWKNILDNKDKDHETKTWRLYL